MKKTESIIAAELLQQLLAKQEDATLEFKSEMYKLKNQAAEGEKREKGELVKDIISLANGNISCIGDTAYLVIGAGNSIDQLGEREIFDVGEQSIVEKDILDIVNEYIEPKLVDLKIEKIQYKDKKLIIISIPATPHMYETIKPLSTPKRIFTEYSVFYRQNEEIRVASTREREALRKLKEIYFAETRNPSPMPFGAIIGALISMLLLANFGKNQFGTIEGQIVGGFIGILFGAFMGGSIGKVYKDLKFIMIKWRKLSSVWRLLVVFFSILIVIAVWYLISISATWLKLWLKSSDLTL